MTTDSDGRSAFVGPEGVEVAQRAVVACALDAYSDQMRLVAFGKLEEGAADADEYVDRALQAALKARAAEPGLPLLLFKIGRCLDLARRFTEARDSYVAFVSEQRSCADLSENENDLVQMAVRRIEELPLEILDGSKRDDMIAALLRPFGLAK